MVKLKSMYCGNSLSLSVDRPLHNDSEDQIISSCVLTWWAGSCRFCNGSWYVHVCIPGSCSSSCRRCSPRKSCHSPSIFRYPPAPRRCLTAGTTEQKTGKTIQAFTCNFKILCVLPRKRIHLTNKFKGQFTVTVYTATNWYCAHYSVRDAITNAINIV